MLLHKLPVLRNQRDAKPTLPAIDCCLHCLLIYKPSVAISNDGMRVMCLYFLFVFHGPFQKKTSKVPEKSFAVGTVAETLEALGEATSHFVAPLYPVVMTMVLDEDAEVRSNSIFCLGILIANGGATVLPYP